MRFYSALEMSSAQLLQTVSVGLWLMIFLFGGTICVNVVLYLIFFTSYWYLAIGYLLWIYIDRDTPMKGGRRLDILSELPTWEYFTNYFPSDLVKTAEIKDDKNYIFVSHPHGVIGMHLIANFGNKCSKFLKLYGNLKVFITTLDMNFRFPILREYLLGLGAVSVSKESLLYLLDSKRHKGHAVVIAVGGAAEALYSTPNNYKLVLKNRKGFVKMALRTGSSLVPVFGFGEVDLYDQYPNPPESMIYKIQKWILKTTGVGLAIPKGVGPFGLLPYRRPITSVVGAPIDVPLTPDPKEEDVNKYHELYIEKLTELFYAHREKYIKDYEKVELVIE